eukprot:3672951-Heterocapsa_arctica.AAC.1
MSGPLALTPDMPPAGGQRSDSPYVTHDLLPPGTQRSLGAVRPPPDPNGDLWVQGYHRIPTAIQ